MRLKLIVGEILGFPGSLRKGIVQTQENGNGVGPRAAVSTWCRAF